MTTQQIQDTFKEIEKHESELSEGTRFFVTSLKKYHQKKKQLSERQQYALLEIRNNLPAA